MNRIVSRTALVSLCVAILAGCTTESSDQSDTADRQQSADQMAAEQTDPQENVQAEEVMIPETNYYRISTSKGDMVIRLFDETPGHRDNFKKLAAEGFYNGTTFHRIIENFMIQGGDPNSKDDNPLNNGSGGPGYTIPAEIQDGLFHLRGALAAARQGDDFNPERRSSGSQFYIVDGQTFDESQLLELQQRIGALVPDFAYPQEVIEKYTTIGGYPPLDLQYTVFGQLVDGFDVLDAIAGAETPRKMGTPPPHSALLDASPEPITMTIAPIEDYEGDANE